MILHKDFVYLHMPKTGGTWMRHICRQMPGYIRETRQHLGLSDIPPDHAHKPVYTHVRNPWDWYVSMYSHWNRNYSQKIHEFISPPAHWDESTRWMAHVFGEDFETSLHRYAKSSRPEVARNQSYSLSFQRFTAHPTINPTVLKFEEGLEQTALRTFEKLDIPLSDMFRRFLLGFGKANRTIHPPYREFYSDKTRQLIAQREQSIIQRFNYQF